MLIGTSAMLALLLGVAASRAILAGCPDGWHGIDLACLFIPTHTDLGIHLLSYAFIGMILWGTSPWLVLWLRLWIKMQWLTRNRVQFCALDSELEPLTRRLGLKNKVQLLDFGAPLCFCTGFISPHLYLSPWMTQKLTPEELEALLLHEKYHLENHDPLKVLLGRLVTSVLFFIPALQDVFKRYLIEKEIAADQNAIQYQGHRRGLAGVLDKLVQERSSAPIEGLAVGGADALEYRIEYLKGHAPQRVYPIPFPHLVTSFLATGLILATILAPLSGTHP